MTVSESIDLTIAILCQYGTKYRHWAITYSGDKDSTATVTLVVHLIETGQIPKPETITVLMPIPEWFREVDFFSPK